jgi:hypothetical protein
MLARLRKWGAALLSCFVAGGGAPVAARPVDLVDRRPAYQAAPVMRCRVPGRARPAGSKLARMAAEGRVGLIRAKGVA